MESRNVSVCTKPRVTWTPERARPGLSCMVCTAQGCRTGHVWKQPCPFPLLLSFPLLSEALPGQAGPGVPRARGDRERAGQHGWLSPRSASRLSSAVSPARSPDCSLLRRRPSPQRARPLTAAAPQPGRRGGQRARRGTGQTPGQAGVKRRPPQPRGRGRGGARAPPIAGLLARGPEAAPTLRRRRQPGEPWARCRPR